MDWSIQEIAKLAGTTSRTLRHYDSVGLVSPSRIGANGYRYYDADALVRLQRVLLLRELGLGIPAIADILTGQRDDTHALRTHRGWLEQERERITRQLASVDQTLAALEKGTPLMAENMFDGFDNTAHRDEVIEKWGSDAYARGDAWWTSLSADEKKTWQAKVAQLAADWADAAGRGIPADGAEAQALAQRQYEWLSGIPGTPQTPDGHPTREYFTGLGEMYVADERFAANYGGTTGAEFVRDAVAVYAERRL
ncbi:MAG TPA: MerR family transcriptional regulator [Pseudolysinimonas sp.]|nr:MerR family transcriptional regulator [Pseudolysinimonas sp.]